MFDFQTEQTDDKKILTIGGELTIHNASALQGVLLDALKETDNLVLNLEKVTAADLSCLQLFCSAYRTAGDSDRRFTLGGKCPGVFKEAAKDAGYLRDTVCGLDCDKECIRLKEDSVGKRD